MVVTFGRVFGHVELAFDARRLVSNSCLLHGEGVLVESTGGHQVGIVPVEGVGVDEAVGLQGFHYHIGMIPLVPADKHTPGCFVASFQRLQHSVEQLVRQQIIPVSNEAVVGRVEVNTI